MLLQVDSVSYQVNGISILKDISLRVEAGQLLAVIGPNGAGKSTLFRLVCGDIEPNQGLIHIGGKLLDEWTPGALAKIRAVLRQQTILQFPFTVEEVISLGLSPYHHELTHADKQSIIENMIELAEISHLRHRSYTTLSGGEQQRTHFARVLAQLWPAIGTVPVLLLLDEPTASLDLQHQHHVLSIARQLTRLGVAVVVVVHDLNLAAQYADHIVLFQKGAVVAAGTPGEVLTKPTLERTFGVTVEVTSHPTRNSPLIVPTGADRQPLQVQPLSEKFVKGVRYECFNGIAAD
ncbi:MAG: heme ABC transporter ATP-binding protein [Acidobacteria bacterium]|nr:heme ABC transporter ATP-binding protein [Acidobacteriota bacterium]